jgi:hypothetical protein
VPTVTVCSSQFHYLAQTEAGLRGYPSMPLVVLPHPFAGRSDDELKSRSLDAAPRIVAAFATTEAIASPELHTRADDDLGPAVVREALWEGDVLDVVGEDELEAVNSAFSDRGWSDGLPIIPPTLERIASFLRDLEVDGDEQLLTLAPRSSSVTWRALAINGVMAGCRPEYMKVVIAALRAMARPEFLLWMVQTTTNPVAPLVVLNGRLAKELRMNSQYNAIGQGWRANMSIGRCIRFALVNLGGGTPGGVDRATHGQPAKVTFCLAEDEAGSPWKPYHARRGYPGSANCVTVFAAGPPHNVLDSGCETPDQTLQVLAASLCAAGSNNFYWGGQPLIIMNAERARFLTSTGYSLYDLQRRLHDLARIPLDSYAPGALELIKLMRPDESFWADGSPLTTSASPEDVQIVVAGGAGRHCIFVPTFFAIPALTEVVEG